MDDHSQDIHDTIIPVDCLATLVFIETSEYTDLETIILSKANKLQKENFTLSIVDAIFEPSGFKWNAKQNEEISKRPRGLKG